MRWIFVMPLGLIAFLVGAVLAFNAGVFHQQLQSWLTAKSAAEVALGPVRIEWMWPPQVNIGATRVHHDPLTVTWQKLHVVLSAVTPPFGLQIELDQPVIEQRAELVVAPAAPANATTAAPAPSQSMALKVQVHQGQYRGPTSKIVGVDFIFSQKQWMRSEASLHLKASVEATALPLPLPLQIDSDGFTLTNETIKASAMKIAVAGLHAELKGTSFLNEDRHRWTATVEAPDLAKLPQPPFDIPAKGWKGTMHLQTEITKGGANQPWSGEGDIQISRAGADLNYRQGPLLIQGPVALDVDAHFQYLNGQPSLPKCSATLELTQAQVTYMGMLNKKPQVPLKLQVLAQGTQDRLQVQSAELRLWNLILHLSGQSELKPPFKGEFHFAIPAVKLVGAEQTFLPLAKSPVQGEMELQGQITGPLMDVMQAHVKIERLHLKNFTAVVDYTQPGMIQARGPVHMSVTAAGEMDRAALKGVQASGDVDLSTTSLALGPLRKDSKQALRLNFSAQNSGDILQISQFNLNSFFGTVKAVGRIKFKPTLLFEDVQLSMSPLNLSELRIALPEFHDVIPKGEMRGEFHLRGRYDGNKPWSDWPMDVDGRVQVQLPEYKMAQSTPSSAAMTSRAPPPVEAATSFLPKGYLTSHLRIKVVADIENFVKDALSIRGLHSDGGIAAGAFQGEVVIRQIFSGHLKLSALEVPLLETRPSMQGTVVFQDLVLQDAIAFAKPEMKDFAKGRASGQASFATYLPGDKDFLAYLKSKGEFVLQQVTLNTVKIGDMLNELIEKVPDIIKKKANLQKVKSTPLQGLVKSDFNLRAQVVQVENLIAQDIDGSEIHMHGNVVVPAMQGDLAGSFAWANPQIKGCLLEGNSDAQGRMIIPVAIVGDLMHPGFSMLSDLIDKLGGKALKCEATKQLQQIQKDGGKKLEQEVKKQLNGLFGK